MQHSNSSSNLYNLIPSCSDTDISNRRSCEILEPIDIRSSSRREIGQTTDLREPLLPAGHRFVDRLDSPNRLYVRRHAIDYLSVETIAATDRDLPERRSEKRRVGEESRF